MSYIYLCIKIFPQWLQLRKQLEFKVPCHSYGLYVRELYLYSS